MAFTVDAEFEDVDGLEAILEVVDLVILRTEVVDLVE